ncbi:uncharacterized protein F4822DRAFT_441804 [Hypoxylon trugodes]|uniref:uncharacterized protein n=1 Tax=Hypoxylon trugodes TaxID=326681 RepID=UPI00218F0228|nr:uncharacterized protein F4822DRAFT_441804 [Hypoxylon trugodes]KAI1382568.1 hypothetical protein F4822DRAFT_441804 [Hypoxylon trugodes]
MTLLEARDTPDPSAHLGKSRFGRALANNLELQQQQGEEARQKYKGQLLRGSRLICPKTETERERLWDAWAVYFRDVQGIDLDSIWISLCEGAGVTRYIREFFAMYIENSTFERPCLGPEEYKTIRGIKSAVSIDGMWKDLIAKAEASVLNRKRREDPLNRNKWTIWIEEGASVEHNLTRQQTFEKKEMTPEDVMMLLGTLWKQARHIPSTARTRQAFHGAVLAAAIGGFRPGEVMNLTYRQVAFELVRDPLDSSKRRLVVSITIRHNKQQENVIQRSQHRLVAFSITVIPCKPICLASLLAARAITDRAFDANFHSLDDMLNRPELGDLDSLPLNWALGVEDKQILPICYPTYWDMWNRTLQVCSLRDDKQRPYSLHVGAGSRLSRNTRDVFLKSYQARHVAHDLVQIAFGQSLPESNGALFNSLRRSFLQRDPDAPLYPTEADLRAFEERQDIRDLRAQYQQVATEKSADHPDAKKIAAKIHCIRHTLSKELLEKRRTEWFRDSDKLRASGKAVSKAPDHDVNPFKPFDPNGASAAEAIGQFMQLDESEYEQGAIRLVDVYSAYLRRRPTEVAALLDTIKKDEGCTQTDNALQETIKHNKRVHFDKGDFDRPFPCPECRRLGSPEYMIVGPMHWSNHAETAHGHAHAPDMPTGLEVRPDILLVDVSFGPENGRCHICDDIFRNAGGFVRHFRVIHLAKQNLFEAVFSCPECVREKVEPTRIDNVTKWQAHLVDAHQGGGLFGPLHSLREPRRQRQKRSRSTVAAEFAQGVEMPTFGSVDWPPEGWFMTQYTKMVDIELRSMSQTGLGTTN